MEKIIFLLNQEKDNQMVRSLKAWDLYFGIVFFSLYADEDVLPHVRAFTMFGAQGEEVYAYSAEELIRFIESTNR